MYLALMVQCQNTVHTVLLIQGSQVQILGVMFNFFHADILGRLGSNLVFIVPFGTSYVEFGTEVWLVPLGNM
jgi:hypothetical protein